MAGVAPEAAAGAAEPAKIPRSPCSRFRRLPRARENSGPVFPPTSAPCWRWPPRLTRAPASFVGSDLAALQHQPDPALYLRRSRSTVWAGHARLSRGKIRRPHQQRNSFSPEPCALRQARSLSPRIRFCRLRALCARVWRVPARTPPAPARCCGRSRSPPLSFPRSRSARSTSMCIIR